jgi:hypothetical protein
MGLAWFDGDSLAKEDLELRSGGLPPLPPDTAWPCCPRCEAPLLFRAQIPLAMTSLVGPLDERTLLLFECHAAPDGEPCDGAVALLASGDCVPRQPPTPLAFDVLLEDAGADPDGVAAVVARLADEEPAPLTQGQVIARAIPAMMAEQTLRVLADAGARVVLRESPPTTLPAMHAGLLVPFDDGNSSTTLPPLAGLGAGAHATRMRGFLGGATVGYRDHSFACSCGKPTRTVARLLAMPEGDLTLAPSVAQLCLGCGRAYYDRVGAR